MAETLLNRGRTTGRDADVADFTFRLNNAPADALRVVRFHGKEALSELFEFVVDLVSEEWEADLDAVLKARATLTIRHEGGQRRVHGIVRSFERTGEGGRLTHYRAAIVPVHWLLTKRQRSRIFQEHNCPTMTVPGIIRKVLEDFGIPSSYYRFAFLDDYPKREYVVQYRETDHAFISRLMEEEGIYYFFEHDEDGHRIVFAGGIVAHTVPLDAQDYPFRDRNGLVAAREFVYELRDVREIQMETATLDDFNFRRPGENLALTHPVNAQAALALSDYPGNYADKEVGERRVRVRHEEQQCRRQTLKLRATARGLRPGYNFNLIDHPDPRMSRTYLVTAVEHKGVEAENAGGEALASSGSRYRALARVIPDGVTFRPGRRTPRAFVRGSQTAIVVGPEHDEIHTDVYGRVKVRFHWDPAGDDETPSEQRSCWIRVSQGWAGGGYGMMFLPRTGHEVIVDFLEGDPDRPIITGRVYNNEHMPPYALPAERTKSTIKTHTSPDNPRYHEIRFEDLHRQEQLFIRAQRRMDTRVTGTHYHTAGGSLHELIGRVGENGDEKGAVFRTVREAAHHHNLGEQLEHVEKRRVTRVEQDVVEAFMANHAVHVQGDAQTKANRIIIGAADSAAGPGEIFLFVGRSHIRIRDTGIEISGPQVKVNCAGPAADALPRIDEKDNLPLPLDALPADDGRPGVRRRSRGTGRPRQPRTFSLEGLTPRPRVPDNVVVPPTTCEIRSITATCSHGRSISSPTQDLLQVVPSEGHVDELKLATLAPACCGEHPEWTVNGKVHPDRAQVITVPAVADPSYSMPLSSAWIPEAKPIDYRISCRGCEGSPQSLRVEAFPARKLDVTFGSKDFVQVNKDVVKAIREDLSYTVFNDVFKLIPLLASEPRGEARARAGWREYSDHQAFYAYDIKLNLSILSIDHSSTLPLVVIPVDFPYTLSGSFELQMDLRRSTPRDPLYSPQYTENAPRQLGRLVFSDSGTLLSNINMVKNVAAYHAEARPIVGPHRFGFRLQVFRDFLKSPTSTLRGQATILDEIYTLESGTVKRI